MDSAVLLSSISLVVLSAVINISYTYICIYIYIYIYIYIIRYNYYYNIRYMLQCCEQEILDAINKYEMPNVTEIDN